MPQSHHPRPRHPGAEHSRRDVSEAPLPPLPPGAATPPPAADATADVFTLLIEPLRRAVTEEGYAIPTPIQQAALSHVLAGRDLFGIAQTGTGKTAAFVLPMLQHLATHQRQSLRSRPRALILAPTRELAAQIGESIQVYGRHVGVRHCVIFGGVGQVPQVSAVNRGVDIVVATPGRLLDLMRQKHVNFEHLEILVLDEADRMLDMGFIRDIRTILATLPKQRQSLFFSATMAAPVIELASAMVRDPVKITITPEQPTVERIVQKVMFVDRHHKDALLAEMLKDPAINRVIVFVQMKHAADRVARKLADVGIPAVALHGNKSQGARTQALAGFRNGRIRVMVATDIAARGLDVDDISHIINYDLPNEPETYVHRIGRTARAGASGDAVSFCAADERDYLRAIERLIRQTVPADAEHPRHSETARLATGAAAKPAPKRQQQGGRRNSQQGGGRAPRSAHSGSPPARGGGQGGRPSRRPQAGNARHHARAKH